MNKEVNVDYLYLDLKTCERCIGTDKVLEEVLTELTPALKLAGLSISYRKTEITTVHMAEQFHFLSSPTIRINGIDICKTVSESNCTSCGEISGTDVDCRVFEYEGQSYTVPPKAMLAEAIMRCIFSPSEYSCNCYTLPQNLKAFFDGKEKNKPSCHCKGNCC